jgi:hypothetical protein
MTRSQSRIGFVSLALVGSLWTSPARLEAISVNVALDTSALAGQRATLAFDFIDGDGGDPAHPEGIKNNTVTISAFFPAAALKTAPPPSGSLVTGGVSGTLNPGPLILTDSAFFNEFLQPVVLGGILGFRVDMTESFVDTSLTVPDAFSFFVLDSDAVNPLVSTSDPAGSLLLFNADGQVQVFTSSPNLHLVVSPVLGVPDASTFVLVVVGMIGLFLRRSAGGRAAIDHDHIERGACHGK